jgi:hypothetical protein
MQINKKQSDKKCFKRLPKKIGEKKEQKNKKNDLKRRSKKKDHDSGDSTDRNSLY